MPELHEIYAQLQKQGYTLNMYQENDREALFEIFCEVVTAGAYFPYEFGSWEDFQHCFFAPNSQVYVCRSDKEIVGGFYLKPNFPGRGGHIANAGYMVKQAARGQGIGKLLGQVSLPIAKEMGFLAMQYNLVLSENLPAVHLWKKIGFEIIGTIPNAICNPNGTYQNAYIMYQAL